MKDGVPREKIETAVFSLLESGLRELGLPDDSTRLDRLTRLVFLLSTWAERISLTGHRDPLEMAGRLVLDAAALSQALPELDSAEILSDLGSGVGFPGIPISILRPELKVILVESRSKRHHLQRQLRRELELENVESLLGRSDEIEVVPSDLVVAQAMTEPREALRLMHPWSRPGGMVVLPASETAIPPDLPAGFDSLSSREYRVPASGRSRRLWLVRLPEDSPDPDSI